MRLWHLVSLVGIATCVPQRAVAQPASVEGEVLCDNRLVLRTMDSTPRYIVAPTARYQLFDVENCPSCVGCEDGNEDPVTVPTQLTPAVRSRFRSDGVDLYYTYTAPSTSSGVLYPLASIQIPGIRMGSTPQDITGAWWTTGCDGLAKKDLSGPSSVWWRDFSRAGKLRAYEHGTSPVGQDYPGQIYAPVAVLSTDGGTSTDTSDDFTLIASLQYPVEEWRHAVHIQLHSAQEGGQGCTAQINDCWWYSLLAKGKYYSLTFDLTPRALCEDLVGDLDTGQPPEAENNHGAWLPAGQTRTYVVSLRVLHGKNTDEGAVEQDWLSGLRAYKSYVQQRYGNALPNYYANAEPVLKWQFAQVENIVCDDDNPRGYHAARPDQVGWGVAIPEVASVLSTRNFTRGMLWAASGLYAHAHNYPFHFASPLDPNSPNTYGAIGTEYLSEWASLTNYDIGLWWGQSGTKMSESWYDCDYEGPYIPTDWTSLNWGDSGDRAIANAEMDSLLGNCELEFGVNMIGLDAINSSPLWYYAQRLREYNDITDPAYVNELNEPITFIGELSLPDVMHTLAPSYEVLFPGGDDEYEDPLTGPHYLALMLGNSYETWVDLFSEPQSNAFAVSQGCSGGCSGSNAFDFALRKVASWGYVPLLPEFPDQEVTIPTDGTRVDYVADWGVRDTVVPSDVRGNQQAGEFSPAAPELLAEEEAILCNTNNTSYRQRTLRIGAFGMPRDDFMGNAAAAVSDAFSYQWWDNGNMISDWTVGHDELAYCFAPGTHVVQVYAKGQGGVAFDSDQTSFSVP